MTRFIQINSVLSVQILHVQHASWMQSLRKNTHSTRANLKEMFFHSPATRESCPCRSAPAWGSSCSPRSAPCWRRPSRQYRRTAEPGSPRSPAEREKEKRLSNWKGITKLSSSIHKIIKKYVLLITITCEVSVLRNLRDSLVPCGSWKRIVATSAMLASGSGCCSKYALSLRVLSSLESL